jgi:hypothetical protein
MNYVSILLATQFGKTQAISMFSLISLAGLYKLSWQKHENDAAGRAFDWHWECMT